MLTVTAADSIDEQVARVEDHRSRDETESDASSSAGLVERLLDELERDGADQNAAAECHNHAERSLSDGETESECAANDQGRRGGEAVCERSEHVPESSWGGQTRTTRADTMSSTRGDRFS